MLFDNCIPFRTRSVVTATVLAFVGTVAFAGAASADRSDRTETPNSRPCFMVRAHWNVALDGPQPTCPAP
jgi:hypothetical protein